MKLSVLINLYGTLPLEEALQKITALDVHCAEVGAGGRGGAVRG